MARFYALFILVYIALVVYTTIDCITTPRHGVRTLPKVVWILLILFLFPIGWIAWFIAGRSSARSSSGMPTWRTGGGFPKRGQSRAPDDDPDFLRGLGQQNREDEQLFKRWEEDLRRREDELRDKDDKDKPKEP